MCAPKQDENAAAAASVYSSVTGDTVSKEEYQKGPKVIVFGESVRATLVSGVAFCVHYCVVDEPHKQCPRLLQEDEHELRWGERATRLFDSLRAVMSDLGGDPDDLIPAEAFVEAAPPQQEVPMSQDQLDDEAFARQLQQLEDNSMLDGIELD